LNAEKSSEADLEISFPGHASKARALGTNFVYGLCCRDSYE